MNISQYNFLVISCITASVFTFSCGNKTKKLDYSSNNFINTQMSDDKVSNSSLFNNENIELSDIFLASGKSSTSLFQADTNSKTTQPSVSISTNVSCDNSKEITKQVINSANKNIKIIDNKNCKITIEKFSLNGNDYLPSASNAKFIFTVDKNRTGSALNKAISYTFASESKTLFVNATSIKPGSFVLGLSDRENRFNADNFNFDQFTLTYNGENEPVILNTAGKYKNKNSTSSDTSFGFVLPDSSNENLHTISYEGNTEATQFTAHVYDENGKAHEVNLKGYSITDKCPTYFWVLNAAVNHSGCGKSQGFKIDYNPIDNSNLKPGKYNGYVIIQALNWEQIDTFQNILINLNIKKLEIEKK